MLLPTLTLVGALAASAVHGHMIMAQPKPFGEPDNSPLSSTGSDWPCKIKGSAPQIDFAQNQFKVGENQTLSFSGSAVHGGGSCQLSVTLDKSPTKDSKFKVIHSIEGGCPGVDGPATFQFPVPEELPNGEAVFAWTWVPRMSGQKEFYMNCGGISISGGAKDSKAFEGLPDLAVLNIQGFCGVEPGQILSFPDPGKSVERHKGDKEPVPACKNDGSSSTQPESGAGASPAAPNNGQPTPQPGSGAGAPSAAPNNGQPTPPASQNASPSSVSAPGASQSDEITSTIRTLVTVTAPTGAPTGGNATLQNPSPTPTAQPQPSSAPESGAGGSGTCSTNGAIVCNGDSQFGICNNGKLVWQPVAPGTKCADGKIAKRGYHHRVLRSFY